MCNSVLWAVGNMTTVDATLSSTNGDGDTCVIHAGTVRHTGGDDNNYIKIPDCSGPQWFADHHITIRAIDQSWVVALWANDQLHCGLYVNDAEEYSTSNPISNGDQDNTIMITMDPTTLALRIKWGS